MYLLADHFNNTFLLGWQTDDNLCPIVFQRGPCVILWDWCTVFVATEQKISHSTILTNNISRWPMTLFSDYALKMLGINDLFLKPTFLIAFIDWRFHSNIVLSVYCRPAVGNKICVYNWFLMPGRECFWEAIFLFLWTFAGYNGI